MSQPDADSIHGMSASSGSVADFFHVICNGTHHVGNTNNSTTQILCRQTQNPKASFLRRPFPNPMKKLLSRSCCSSWSSSPLPARPPRLPGKPQSYGERTASFGIRRTASSGHREQPALHLHTLRSAHGHRCGGQFGGDEGDRRRLACPARLRARQRDATVPGHRRRPAPGCRAQPCERERQLHRVRMRGTCGIPVPPGGRSRESGEIPGRIMRKKSATLPEKRKYLMCHGFILDPNP